MNSTISNFENPIKVMIVDDDKILLDDMIAQYNWTENNFEIVATATNGLMALKYFNELNPQLVIADIVMPMMNGIELLQEIRKVNKTAYVVLLTSYNDFSYAQQGLKFKANDYILKNEFTSDVLSEKMDLIKEQIIQSRKQHAFLERKILSDYLHNKSIAPPILSTDMNSYIFNTFCNYVIVQKSTPITINKVDLYRENSSHVYPLLESVTHEITSSLSVEYIVPYGMNQYLIILSSPKINSQVIIDNLLRDFCNQLALLLHKDSTNTFAMLYSTMAQSLSTFTQRCDKLSIQTRSFAFSNPETKIYDISSILLVKDIPDFNANIEIIKSAIETHDFTALYSMFNAMIRQSKLRQGVHIDVDEISKIFDCIDFIYYSQNLHHLFFPEVYSYPDFFNWCLDILNNLDEDNTQTLSLPVKETIQYIHSNYNISTLNIPMLANNVYLSPGYLSTLFKKETNKNINEYILDVRMKNAKDLLNDPAFKIYEIASHTGYSSSQYFSQAFCKYFGMSPKNYRRQNQHEH